VEHRQHRRGLRRKAHLHRQPLRRGQQPWQQGQRDPRGADVERHVRGGRALGVGGRAEHREQGRGGGADLGADDHRGRGRQRNHAAGCGGERDRERGAGRLHQDGQHRAHRGEQQRAQHAIGGQPLQIEGVAEIVEAVLEGVEAEEEDPEADERLAQRRAPAAAADPQAHAHRHGRHAQHLQVQVEADKGHDPRGERGADVGTEHDADGLTEVEQPGVDEADRGEHHRARRLHQGGDQHARADPARGAASAGGQQAAQGRARSDLEAVAHQPHAEQEEADAAGEMEEAACVHRCPRGRQADHRRLPLPLGKPRRSPRWFCSTEATVLRA
jgi:hypothetical protein